MRNWKIGDKLFVSYAISMTVMAAILTGLFSYQLYRSNRQQLRARVLEILYLALPQIDPDYHALSIAPKDARSPYHAINQRAISRIQATDPDILHIFTLRRQRDNTLAYILSHSPSPEHRATLGMPFDSIEGFSVNLLSEEKPWLGNIIHNERGLAAIYGFIPILDGFGRVDGYLGIELDASEIVRREERARGIALGAFLGVLGISFFFMRWWGRFLVVKPILQLNEAAKELAGGQWERRLAMERGDEFDELARSFNEMAAQLQASFRQLQDYSQNLEGKVETRTRELSESQQLLNLVMSNIPQSIFWKNRENVYMGVNESFAKVAGMTPEEIVGKTDYQMPWSRKEADFYIECDRRVMQAGVSELGIVEPITTGDGRQRWLETSKVPLHNPDGDVVGIIGIFQDITPYKEAERAARAANEAKSEFLANMSHELRTPLNGILGYAQILQRSEYLPEKERRGVNAIYQSGSHLLTLINDVLDLSKIEARKLELIPKALHLPSFLQGVVEICRIRAEQKGLAFFYTPDANLPEAVGTDEKRLRQVLINLLGNAAKFTDRGSITLKIDVVERSATAARLRFSIIDTGVGIASEQIEAIFQPFEQAGDRRRQSEGTGLGLAISTRIVALMGGQLKVQSQIGTGSTFCFEIELPSVENWAAENTLEAGRAIIGYEGERRTIAIVDDIEENRAVLRHLLELLGFDVTEAENGKVGLERARESPDLMFLDLSMPVMDGFALLRALQDEETLKSLKIIVCSASVSESDRQKSLQNGADDFLAKPVQTDELFALLRHHLDLAWIYRDETQTDSSIAREMEIIPPDRATLAGLLQLARQGRLKKLADIAKQSAISHPETEAFAEEAIALAQRFEVEALEAFLEEFLTQKPED